MTWLRRQLSELALMAVLLLGFMLVFTYKALCYAVAIALVCCPLIAFIWLVLR